MLVSLCIGWTSLFSYFCVKNLSAFGGFVPHASNHEIHRMLTDEIDVSTRCHLLSEGGKV